MTSTTTPPRAFSADLHHATADRFEILQQPDVVLMAFKRESVRRLIALPVDAQRMFNFGPSTEDLVSMKMGTSTGHWKATRW
jgi:hypothetical protein